MCGRYSLSCTTKDLESIFDLIPMGYREERRYNIAPGQWVIVIRPEREWKRVMGIARWGLVPSWAKDPEAGPKPINARAEGINEKPTFRGAFRHGRCLIPASGFFEWMKAGKAKPEGKGELLWACGLGWASLQHPEMPPKRAIDLYKSNPLRVLNIFPSGKRNH